MIKQLNSTINILEDKMIDAEDGLQKLKENIETILKEKEYKVSN